MPVPPSSFTNPSTATTYRLVVTGNDWRITKVRHDEDRLRLVHLRGQVGAGMVDVDAVARLVAGTGGMLAGGTNPVAMFAEVVLCDLEGTANVLMAIARDADEVFTLGCRGFRPRSPILRRQRDTALHRATAECREMAAAWRASGLAVEHRPAWLDAALADADTYPD